MELTLARLDTLVTGRDRSPLLEREPSGTSELGSQRGEQVVAGEDPRRDGGLAFAGLGRRDEADELLGVSPPVRADRRCHQIQEKGDNMDGDPEGDADGWAGTQGAGPGGRRVRLEVYQGSRGLAHGTARRRGSVRVLLSTEAGVVRCSAADVFFTRATW